MEMEDDTSCIILLSDDDDPSKPGCSGANASEIIPSESSISTKSSMSRTRCLFSEFLEKCRREDDTNDMKRVIKKMWMRYENSNPAYRHSSGFSTFLENMMQRNNEPYAVLKDVSDELKNNKKSNDDNSNRGKRIAKNKNEKTMDLKTSKHLSKLYKTLFLLSKKIETLRQAELTLSEDEDSAYIVQDRYERRFTMVYNKICEIIKEPNHAGRVTLKDISFKDTEYKVLNRCIERYYNKERVVPDFVDIRNMVQTVNNSNKEGVVIKDVHNTASDAFRKFLDLIIKRRCYDDYMLANDYVRDSKDPADDDEELRKKLEANRGKLQKDVTEVIDDYAKKQTELRLKSSEAEGDEEEAESEEEDLEDESEASNFDEFLVISDDEDNTEVNHGEDSRILEDEELSTKQYSVIVDDVKYTISCSDSEMENSSNKQVPEMIEVSCKRKSSIINTNASKKAKIYTDEEENALFADNDADDSQPIEDPLQMKDSKNEECNGEVHDEIETPIIDESVERKGDSEEELNGNDKGEQEVDRVFLMFEETPEDTSITLDTESEGNRKQNGVNEIPVNRIVYQIEDSSIELVEDSCMKVKSNMMTEVVNEKIEEKDLVHEKEEEEEEENVEGSKSEDDVVVIGEYNTASRKNSKQPKPAEEDVIDVESIPEEKRRPDISLDFDVNRFIRSIGMDLSAKRNVTNGNRNVPQRQLPALPAPVDRFSSRNAVRIQPNVKKILFPFTSRFPNSNVPRTNDYLAGLNRRSEVTIRPILTSNPVRHGTHKPLSKFPSYQPNTRGILQASSSRAGRPQPMNSTISQIQQSQSSYRNMQSGDTENRCVQTLKEVKTSNGQVLTSTYTTFLHQSVQNINKSQKKVVPSKDTEKPAPARKKIFKVPPVDVEVITIE